MAFLLYFLLFCVAAAVLLLLLLCHKIMVTVCEAEKERKRNIRLIANILDSWLIYLLVYLCMCVSS